MSPSGHFLFADGAELHLTGCDHLLKTAGIMSVMSTRTVGSSHTASAPPLAHMPMRVGYGHRT
jgi:hypothetical protein